jgi:hypothetical protein
VFVYWRGVGAVVGVESGLGRMLCVRLVCFVRAVRVGCLGGGSAVVVELGSNTVKEKDFLFKEKIFLKLCDFLDKPPIPASFGFPSSSTVNNKYFKKKIIFKAL